MVKVDQVFGTSFMNDNFSKEFVPGRKKDIRDLIAITIVFTIDLDVKAKKKSILHQRQRGCGHSEFQRALRQNAAIGI